MWDEIHNCTLNSIRRYLQKKYTSKLLDIFSELVACVRDFLCSKVDISVFYVCPILYPQFKKAQKIFEL